MKKNLLIALGIGLVAGTVSYFLIKKKNKKECVEVEEENKEPEKQPCQEDIIERAVSDAIEEANFSNPGDSTF